MLPVLAALKAEYGERVVFLNYDWDQKELSDFGGSLAVRGHPTYVVINPDGEEVGRVIGTSPREQLEELIKKALSEE